MMRRDRSTRGACRALISPRLCTPRCCALAVECQYLLWRPVEFIEVGEQEEGMQQHIFGMFLHHHIGKVGMPMGSFLDHRKST